QDESPPRPTQGAEPLGASHPVPGTLGLGSLPCERLREARREGRERARHVAVLHEFAALSVHPSQVPEHLASRRRQTQGEGQADERRAPTHEGARAEARPEIGPASPPCGGGRPAVPGPRLDGGVPFRAGHLAALDVAALDVTTLDVTALDGTARDAVALHGAALRLGTVRVPMFGLCALPGSRHRRWLTCRAADRTRSPLPHARSSDCSRPGAATRWVRAARPPAR